MAQIKQQKSDLGSTVQKYRGSHFNNCPCLFLIQQHDCCGSSHHITFQAGTQINLLTFQCSPDSIKWSSQKEAIRKGQLSPSTFQLFKNIYIYTYLKKIHKIFSNLLSGEGKSFAYESWETDCQVFSLIFSDFWNTFCSHLWKLVKTFDYQLL